MINLIQWLFNKFERQEDTALKIFEEAHQTQAVKINYYLIRLIVFFDDSTSSEFCRFSGTSSAFRRQTIGRDIKIDGQ